MPRATTKAKPLEKDTAPNAATPEKDWTVLAYLGGENNLFDEMVFAIKAMKSGVTPPVTVMPDDPDPEFNFNALVQFGAEDPYRPTSALRNPRRFKLTPGDLDGAIKKDYWHTPQSSLPRQSNSYEEGMVEFLLWGIENGPAKHYMVILSGHGLGIESDFLSKDSTPRQSLTLKELRRILCDGRVRKALGTRTIDILGLDSCLMSMVEIGYELRNAVRIMIASQGSQANLGWPYKGIFGYLQGNSKADPELLAQNVVMKFVDYYDDFAAVADDSADLSACRLRYKQRDYMQELKHELDQLADSLLKLIPLNAKTEVESDPECQFSKSLIFAHWYSQTYHSDQYVDIQDLCDVLPRSLPSGSKYRKVKAKCEAVKTAVRNCIIEIESRNYTGPLYQYSYGISIYLPWSEIYKLYNSQQLDFLKGDKWMKFVDRYIAFTRRPPRPARNGQRWGELTTTKDSPPHSKGDDDPSIRAKNPPSTWRVPDTFLTR